jgi:hypothetical protein
MDKIEALAQFLQNFGGWGVCVVLILAIIYLYKSMSTLLEKRNDQFREVLKETSVFLQQNAQQNERVEGLLRRIERILEK